MGRAKHSLLLVGYMMLIKYVFCITSINTLLDCIKSSIDTPTLVTSIFTKYFECVLSSHHKLFLI